MSYDLNLFTRVEKLINTCPGMVGTGLVGSLFFFFSRWVALECCFGLLLLLVKFQIHKLNLKKNPKGRD